MITFLGSAFSIMAFNNDVDVGKMFGQVYEQLTGDAVKWIYTVGSLLQHWSDYWYSCVL